MSRFFHLGDVLSITSGVLVAPRGMAGVYDILNYMTGDSLFTHQLPRAADECRPWLLRQHPDLAEVDATGVDRTNWGPWLNAQLARFGEHVDVEPIPREDHLWIDPLQELREMTEGQVPIITIEIQPDKQP